MEVDMGIMIGKRVTLALCMIFMMFGQALATDKAPITIVTMFAHSGIAAEENVPSYRVAAIAAEMINEAGGVLGRKIKLVPLDNKSTVLGARQAARKAVTLGATAVIGPSWSSHAMAVAPILQKASIIMIGTTTTNDRVTRLGDFIFRICYNDTLQSKALAKLAFNDLGARKAAILAIAGDVYSEELSDIFARRFTELGGRVVVRDSYLQSSMDFARQLAGIKAMQPDLVFVPGYARDSGLILKQARNMGLAMPFLGGDGWTALEEYRHLGPAKGDNYYVSHWHSGSDYPGNRRFVKLLTDKLGPDALSKIDAGNPCSYDALLVLADAIRRAGSTDTRAIRDSLLATRNFAGATGAITFAGARDPMKPVVVLKIRPKGVEYLKSVMP